MKFDVIDLGLIEYDVAWKLQETFALEIAAGARHPTLLLLEHPHIYTFGRQGHPENLLWTEQQLNDHAISVRWVDRGGDVTYHGPGQLVGYPLFPLGPAVAEAGGAGRSATIRLPKADYVGYVRRLERALITALAKFGLTAGQMPGFTGVWVQADVHSRCTRCLPEDRRKPAKIAAIGIKIDVRGVSRHGFALNVDPDVTYWDGIIACGLAGYPLVSLADLLRELPSMERVKAEIAVAFGEIFDQETR